MLGKKDKVLVFFQNFGGYDSHLILLGLQYFKRLDIILIASAWRTT